VRAVRRAARGATLDSRPAPVVGVEEAALAA
jgi:hypothetical protein